MMRDADIERALQAWLDDEAQPMPSDVLEASLEAISRTTQVRRYKAFTRPWFGQRLFVVGLATAAIVLVVVTAPAILDRIGQTLPGFGDPTASPDQSVVWDAAADFVDAPNQQNPAPDAYGRPAVWSYRRSAGNDQLASVTFLLPSFKLADGSSQWYDPGSTNLFVAHVPGSPALSLHPWSDGDPSRNRDALVSWVAPFGGWYAMASQATAQATTCSDGADGVAFTIYQDASILRTVNVGLGGSERLEADVRLESGDELTFVISAGANALCDGMSLTIRIQSIALDPVSGVATPPG